MAPDLIPGHDALFKPEEPGIYVYLPPPEHATKTGVLVFPGVIAVGLRIPRALTSPTF